MKRTAAVLTAAIFILSLAVVAHAAETRRGTIKDVDVKAGTITFCPEGTTTDMMLKADKDLDLRTVRPETKAEVTVDGGAVKGVREIKQPRKAAVGC